MALSMEVDVSPGSSVGKGELIRGETDNVAAIVVVEFFAQLNNSASAERYDIGNTGGSPEPRPWETCEGVEVDVVDERADIVEYQLDKTSATLT